MATFPATILSPDSKPTSSSSPLHCSRMLLLHQHESQLDLAFFSHATSTTRSSSSCTRRRRSCTIRASHSDCSPQLRSLISGRWLKLICGASFEDVAHVRNLSLVYTLAGVDCIDCAADPSIVAAVREGIGSALHIWDKLEHPAPVHIPWVMVSINDDTDLHFRKAEFVASKCPSDCARPCERVCPASAIWFNTSQIHAPDNNTLGGVLTDRCYGCGRCIPVCPFGLIGAHSYMRDPEAVSHLFDSGNVDAVEIHTTARNLEPFKKLWERIHSSAQSLKLVAVSLPDLGEDMIPTMWDIYRTMRPELCSLNIWQLDGRPMSGDIGAGATKAAISLGRRVAACSHRPPGFLQLAGGTNAQTVQGMRTFGFCQENFGDTHVPKEIELITNEKIENEKINCAPIAGIAYGGYARKIVCEVLEKMSCSGSLKLENHPLLLIEALNQAKGLVQQLKMK